MLEIKKIPSAEPTGVGRFLLNKYLFLNFTRVKKVFHTKVVGIERSFPTIPHMTAFCTVLF